MEESIDIAQQLTDALKTPWGTWTLKPVQALALLEIGQWGGAFLPIRVGGGKSLISLLAARMIPSARPLLLVPAHLRDKTYAEMSGYRKNFVIHPAINIVSYQTLSTVNNATLLEGYKPDMIIADEAHYLKNTAAACTKRVSRYLKSRQGTVPFVAMSGTMTKRSIRDFAHLASWSLRDRSPCPIDWGALDEWSRALDVNVHESRRLLPGALRQLRTTPQESIREAYQRRLMSVPGVVASRDEPLPIEIELRTHLMHYPSPHWNALRDDWCTPDGWKCAEGVEVWRHARELAIGCWYRWNPRPPEEWVEARSAWGKACRGVLSNNRRNLDSQLQVMQAVQAGHYPHVMKTLADWKAIEPTFKPNVEAVWESNHATDWVKNWAAQSPGIVWVSHRFLGPRLAPLPYFGGGGVDTRTGDTIESWDPSRGSIVASIAANGTGRNLQSWSRNLIVGAPPNGSQWEQLIGRTVRPGQKAKKVTVDVLLGCVEDVAALWTAVSDAKYAQEMTGQTQKLCRIDLTQAHTPDSVAGLGTAQWIKTKKKEE